MTFKEMKDIWLENIHKKEVKEDTYLDNKRRLENHAIGLDPIPIADLSPLHLIANFAPLVAENKPETIKKTTNLIRAICDQAVIAMLIKVNPAARIHKAFPKSKKAKPLPYIKADQLHRVFEKAINGTLTRQSKDLLMCYILTAVRAKELVAAKWENLKGNVLTIEGRYMKNGNDFDIYLSNQARAILERQIKVARSPFIFTHRTKNDEGSSPETITSWLREEAGFRGELVTHGFRKMFSTWANEQLNLDETNTLYPAQIIERCLDHLDDDKIRSIYNGAIYPKLRLAVMQGWGVYVGTQWQQAVSNLGMSAFFAPALDDENSNLNQIGL
jgi:integrase